ncbi:hypothetical protein [Cohnella abietis]|uniref:Uncharacterized protein n=1 Tax=Cohnella abietis TaxID=2507935 RepID=A0A3T1D2M9_9BACL|nr:hypothetical protein [Cohnella abietis]BBI32362.1 hypothetical protein KCTCHS21_17610 [Cohnella abietis]
MLYAIKGNKQLQIDPAEKETYLKLGYDIAEVDGDTLNVVETSPVKTIPYVDYKRLQDENELLKEQLAGAGEGADKEIKALKEKLAEANKKLKEATGG